MVSAPLGGHYLSGQTRVFNTFHSANTFKGAKRNNFNLDIPNEGSLKKIVFLLVVVVGKYWSCRSQN
jgi:hypothetical protein